MNNRKIKVAVIFGGTNTEHEISIVSAIQAMEALKDFGHSIIPIYITKKGTWLLGDNSFTKPETYKHPKKLLDKHPTCSLIPKKTPTLKTQSRFIKKTINFNVAFPIFHGKNGEDGTVQGLLKLYNIPYAGCTHIPSTVGIDKHISKRIAESLGIKTAKDIVVYKHDWEKNKKNITKKASKLSQSVFIKPVKLGSSIGITKAKNSKEIEWGIDVAFAHDTKVLIEESIEDMMEVNISILGNNPYQVSITEMTAGLDEILSFQDKYLRSNKKTSDHNQMGMASLQRQIPAPVSKKIIKKIEQHSKDFFQAIDGRGMARIDYMVKDEKIYFNEINTIPGSLSFYLWKETNLPFPKLVNRLVELAIDDWNQNQKQTTIFTSNILSHYNEGAAKGAKTS